MTKTAKQILERVYNKGFNDRCQQEKHADIDNQFVFALSVDQALKELEALIRTEKLKLLAEVRERTAIFKVKAHDKKGQPHLYEAGRGVPTEVVDKLEAEL